MILGINPGRHGAGVTGITFTDTKRLWEKCGIKAEGRVTHEPSSVFFYEIIDAFGGVEKFYSHFMSQPCALWVSQKLHPMVKKSITIITTVLN
ncbi:MAG: DUF4918 family protein [Bacteroidales bacterium]|nr:DUF4918 family protein [Bacteroidales bacterium]